VRGFELAGICLPANRVGGDYYNYLWLDENHRRLAIVLADVSGHAMEAATVAMRFTEILRYETRGRSGALGIVEGLDNSVRGQIPLEMFITCGIAVLDVDTQTMVFASAANPEVYHFVRETGQTRPLAVTGYPLGLPLDLHSQRPFSSTEMQLVTGDAVVFVSDGVEDAQNETGEFYGADRLSTTLGTAARVGQSADGIRDEIVADVEEFMGSAPQADDITVVVLTTE
jgi:serine phosphatase RsbU (regulator of sigma subunit)